MDQWTQLEVTFAYSCSPLQKKACVPLGVSIKTHPKKQGAGTKKLGKVSDLHPPLPAPTLHRRKAEVVMAVAVLWPRW